MTEIVRRPDFAGGGITDEERAKMAEYVKLWTRRAFRTEPIEPDKIVPAIKGIYAAANLKEPRVVIVPSPRVMAFAGGAAAAIWYQRKQGAPATDDATRAAAAATYDATFDATYAATRAATHAATRDATCAATFALKCASQWCRMYQGGNMWTSVECYLAAARDILGLNLEEHAKYSHWEAAAIHGGFRIMHEEFCMVSDFPEVLKVDNENRPHCEDGPSHKWRDGWTLHHWHGVRIPGEWIEDRASLTAAIALTRENIEERRAACEILGWDAILKELNATTIDADEDPEVGELLECDIPDIGREKFLRVRCGTGRTFALPVPPGMQTALEANSWTYGFDADSFIKPEVRT